MKKPNYEFFVHFRVFPKKLFFNVYLIIALLVLIAYSSCKSQSSQNSPQTNKTLKESFDSFMKYCDSNISQLSCDSLVFYTDSLFRYSYKIDTTGSNSNGLMMKLLEQALKIDPSSSKAANRLFNLYAVKKQYEKAIEVSNIYLNDTSNIIVLLGKSMMYYKIGEKAKADSGFDFVKKRCELILKVNPNPKKESYLGNTWMISLILFSYEGKEKALLNFQKAKDKYPDDRFVSGLYENIEGYKNVDDLIEKNLP